MPSGTVKERDYPEVQVIEYDNGADIDSENRKIENASI